MNKSLNKSLFVSYTFWFGVAQIVLAALGFMSGQMDSQASLALATTGIGTIGFRLKTNTGIAQVS